MVFRDFVVVRDHDNGISFKGSKMNKAVFMNRPWLSSGKFVFLFIAMADEGSCFSRGWGEPFVLADDEEAGRVSSTLIDVDRKGHEVGS